MTPTNPQARNGIRRNKNRPQRKSRRRKETGIVRTKKPKKRRRRARAEERGRKFFEEKDIDGDGALTQMETGNLMWVFLHMADEDGDGKVTGEEAKAYGEAARAGNFKRPAPTKVIEIMDTDGDGMIGSQELPERARPMLNFADVDGDGKVSIAEIEVLNAMQDAGIRPGAGSGGGAAPPQPSQKTEFAPPRFHPPFH